MKIITDEDGLNAIKGLVDLALKTGGIQNLDNINKVLDSCEIIKEKPQENKNK